MTRPSIVSPDDQNVTFVELFFDLVFVFAVTQTVGLLHAGVDAPSIGRAVLVFWLVWWAWTQFTWALNAADTTHAGVQLTTLVATAVAFFMAIALPQAFGDRAIWFAIPYVLVRTTGLVLYMRVAAAAGPGQHRAVRTFGTLSVGGLAAVVAGGIAGGDTQYWLWAMAILLDVVAATVGAQSDEWDLHPSHFVERHGLFVIIALGETLIVAAGGAVGASWDIATLAVAILAVTVTCALWWTYFPRAKARLDEAMESLRGAALSEAARDAFSLIHFPMLCGIVAVAVTVEAAVAHPHEPLDIASRAILASGLVLFVGGTAAAVWRATGTWLLPRLVATSVTAVAITALPGLSPAVTLGMAAAGTALVAAVEHSSGRVHSTIGAARSDAR
jgi:low temperature requirement protein LtrA